MGKESQYNVQCLLWVGFMVILVVGVGFFIWGGIFVDWGIDFKFLKVEFGVIIGGGLIGFGIIILLGFLFVDWLGYGCLMVVVFVFYFLLVVLILVVILIYVVMVDFNLEFVKFVVYICFYFGMFLFVIGNGIVEVVVNLLVVVFFFENKIYYLNILYVGWLVGLVVGGLVLIVMVG